jgi:hypothetical protein
MNDGLTLFVVQSRMEALDPGPTVESFEGLVSETFFVPNIQAINEAIVKTDWYAVIHDNEHIDDPLLEGLKVFIKESPADMLVLRKKSEEQYFKAPRLFRRDVMLRQDVLLPAIEGLDFDTVLNGMIHDNDQV